ncbi:hypothetical protein Trydic_g2049 [Trypoxylus dichotomus]
MYSFPKELEMARRWFALFGRDDFIGKEFKTVRKNYRVCGAHFDSSWMFEAYNNRTDLKQNSIPSLKLPEQGCFIDSLTRTKR